jgi:hypothetical protein
MDGEPGRQKNSQDDEDDKANILHDDLSAINSLYSADGDLKAFWSSLRFAIVIPHA